MKNYDGYNEDKRMTNKEITNKKTYKYLRTTAMTTLLDDGDDVNERPRSRMGERSIEIFEKYRRKCSERNRRKREERVLREIEERRRGKVELG